MRINTEDIVRRAWQLREDFRGRGEFTTGAYLRELTQAVPELPAEELRALAAWVDAASTRPRPISGLFDLQGEYRLRAGRRVAKAMALREHTEEAIALSEELMANWNDSN
jgi:hypothetical protein